MKFRHFFLLIALGSLCFLSLSREIKWDWSTLNIFDIWFPSNFLWGCSDSALQTEGIITVDGKTIENSWTHCEKLLNSEVTVGHACQRWDRYKEDHKLLQDIGMNAYRFSVEWSKIEPSEGCFDEQAMQHYVDAVDDLLARGIEPMITLFHHTCPLWFYQKGTFENQENITYFVRFARYVFSHLHNKIKFWIIFNEPVAYAFEGYFRGVYPPFKKSLALAGRVVLNQLNAHVEVAKEFRKINPSAQIGIAHMCHPLDAYSKWDIFAKAITKTFSHLINQTTINFFKKGKFRWLPPWVSAKNKDAKKALDFFGVNYYTHTTVKHIRPFKMEARTRPNEIIIDESESSERTKVMYPEGLYRYIVRASELNIPIYITENGVASENPAIKDEYIKKHLYVVSRAIREGYNIKGYFYWTLMDCFSWNKGYSNKHGIFEVDFETQERTLRSSVSYLLETVQRFRG
ncbi:MAG: glycoside hydrolase family 1 protein [Candidatus Babeliales bacterium]